MSDYLFMLENHLSAAQSKMVMEVQNAAAEANVNVFLTGGAMRDMLGGFPMRDIEFTVEGSGVKLAKAVVAKSGAEITDADESRKAAALLFPDSVNARIVMAHQERYGKAGSKPHIQPATIHEDLRGRDFTINAIALSLSKASRGLILDPNNGIGDLEHKELRAVSNYTLYHDPIRLFRLQRLRVRLGFEIEERTKVQYANARAEKLETHIPASALL
ncbi:MAG: CCA tRNA nucleotidyltransferase, partial [Bryobacteraceae bacterium]